VDLVHPLPQPPFGHTPVSSSVNAGFVPCWEVIVRVRTMCENCQLLCPAQFPLLKGVLLYSPNLSRGPSFLFFSTSTRFYMSLKIVPHFPIVTCHTQTWAKLPLPSSTPTLPPGFPLAAGVPGTQKVIKGKKHFYIPQKYYILPQSNPLVAMVKGVRCYMTGPVLTLPCKSCSSCQF
jgi:hypothetical protein